MHQTPHTLPAMHCWPKHEIEPHIAYDPNGKIYKRTFKIIPKKKRSLSTAAADAAACWSLHNSFPTRPIRCVCVFRCRNNKIYKNIRWFYVPTETPRSMFPTNCRSRRKKKNKKKNDICIKVEEFRRAKEHRRWIACIRLNMMAATDLVSAKNSLCFVLRAKYSHRLKSVWCYVCVCVLAMDGWDNCLPMHSIQVFFWHREIYLAHALVDARVCHSTPWHTYYFKWKLIFGMRFGWFCSHAVPFSNGNFAAHHMQIGIMVGWNWAKWKWVHNLINCSGC